MKSLRVTVTAIIALALGACAGTPRMGDADRLELHRAHAGAPVSSFPLRGQLDGWTALGDQALVVWTRPREAWLLELAGPCQDLGYATAISLSSSGSRVHAKFDGVVPLGAMTSQVGRFPCRIHEIRPLDTKALKQAQDGLREARVEPRREQP
jgi:hypothetical protein